MPRSRRVPAVLAILLALSARLPAFAADCDGGSVNKLRIESNRLRFEGTVTRSGVTHATFVSGAPLQLRIVNAGDGATVYGVDIPADRFTTLGRKTRYDHAGDFQGDVIIKDATAQADTVRVVVRAVDTGLGSVPVTDLRAWITTGGGCARSCVAGCDAVKKGVRCRRSDLHVPFADAGFGALARPSKRTQNPLCGLAVDTSTPCDFLIEERCVLPYPSSYFLKPDASTPTGLRVELRAAGAAEERAATSTSIRPTGTRSTASARGR